jgi:hypothetical protein
VRTEIYPCFFPKGNMLRANSSQFFFATRPNTCQYSTTTFDDITTTMLYTLLSRNNVYCFAIKAKTLSLGRNANSPSVYLPSRQHHRFAQHIVCVLQMQTDAHIHSAAYLFLNAICTRSQLSFASTATSASVRDRVKRPRFAFRTYDTAAFLIRLVSLLY